MLPSYFVYYLAFAFDSFFLSTFFNFLRLFFGCLRSFFFHRFWSFFLWRFSRSLFRNLFSFIFGFSRGLAAFKDRCYFALDFGEVLWQLLWSNTLSDVL